MKPSISLIRHCISELGEIDEADQDEFFFDVHLYIKNAFSLSPWYFKCPFTIIQILFFIYAYFCFWRLFENQSLPERELTIKKWSRISKPSESLIKVYRSLVMLNYYENINNI